MPVHLVSVAALALALILIQGCDRGDPTVHTWGKELAAPTADERILIDQLARDPFVQIVQVERQLDPNGDPGHLLVTTQQGRVTVRYLLAPVASGGKDLTIRRIAEDLELLTEVEPGKGTGPEDRGLHR